MDSQLQAYYDADPGFAQFVDRHTVVAATPEVRKAYRRWQYDQMLYELDKERQEEKINARLIEREAIGEARGKEMGEAIGEARGRADRDMEIALRAFSNRKIHLIVSEIVEMLREYEISDEIIEAAAEQCGISLDEL